MKFGPDNGPLPVAPAAAASRSIGRNGAGRRRSVAGGLTRPKVQAEPRGQITEGMVVSVYELVTSHDQKTVKDTEAILLTSSSGFVGSPPGLTNIKFNLKMPGGTPLSIPPPVTL